MKNQIRIGPVLTLGALLGGGIVLLFFLNGDAGEVREFLAQRPTLPTFELSGVADAPPHQPPAQPDQGPELLPPPKPWVKRSAKDCTAMTWRVLAQHQMKVTVGHVANVTNPYLGDTPCSEKRALLCISVVPAKTQRRPYVAPEWNELNVLLIADVSGIELSSRAVADERCAKKFGTGWRMAEFHDGGAWKLEASGELPTDAKFWVAINDQHANPWD